MLTLWPMTSLRASPIKHRLVNDYADVLLADQLSMPNETVFSEAVLIDSMAVMVLQQTLERFNGIPEECFQALADSPSGTPRSKVFSSIPGGSLFDPHSPDEFSISGM